MLINVLLSISLLRPVAVANPATIVESAGLIESTEHSLPLLKQVDDRVSNFASVNASVELEPASSEVEIC